MIKKIIILFFVFVCNIPVQAREKIEYKDMQDGVYVFKINTKKYGKKIKPVMAKRTVTPEKLYGKGCYELVVNGGFFDVKSGISVSNITIDGIVVANITDNVELAKELKKEGRLKNVLSRSELRILETKRGKLKFDIACHNDPIQKRYKIKHSLQAGPMVYPAMDLVKEGFVVYEDNMVKLQCADILKRRERTVIGLKGKNLYIVIFSGEHKTDANEIRDYLVDNLKIKKAMALDGGLSTAVNYKDFSIGSMNQHQRRVKSFLVVEK